MNPLVSVIVPNYNHAKFLSQRLDSIFAQTYQNYEVILLDDCSKDRSAEILEKYAAHPKVSHIVINKKNSGSAFAQWEKGIALAKGAYIWIAESDDFCETDFLETLLPFFSQKENVGLVYCRSNNVDEQNRFHNIFWPDDLDAKKWKQDYCNNGIDEVKTVLKYRNTIPNASACIFRKETFDFSEIKNMFYAGDWMFWTKILVKSNICFSSKTLNHFRFHPNTTRTVDPLKKNYRKYSEYLSVLLFIYRSINEKFSFERKHFWIYNEFYKQSVSLLHLFLYLRPFFYPYLFFRYKLLKHRIKNQYIKR
ncbi:glycosyltransferase family 2 protein [uncultured Chryseobacterium sp.]|uniref:glycosyltransferase family 2 protein n=1 Tax=uncultured Chryseobacterium sp. TaxID=259322 RepID=UPI0025F3684C|nr:glycosyltransferase family 2 protein [uncultured Chryseobacterium sp.]